MTQGSVRVPVPRGADRVADRLVHGLGEAAELADVEVDPSDLVGIRGLLRHQHHLGLDQAGIADHAAARLDDRLGDLVAEMLGQAPEDRLAVALHARHRLEVLGREAAAEIDHRQADAALRAFAEDRRRGAERPVPGLGVALLRADMERDAVGLQPLAVGVLQHVRGHLGHAAELAGQRPVGPGPVAQDAAEHPHLAGRHAQRVGGPGDLLDLGLAIDREQADAELQRAADAALLLDGVAVGDPVGGGAGGQHHLHLGHRRGVEAGAHLGEQAQHLGGRVRLHGVEHAGVRQGRARRRCSCRARRRGRGPSRGPRPDRGRGGRAGSHGCDRSWSSPGTGSRAPLRGARCRR